MKAFLISCGGTGGHMTPGIALAEGLTAKGHRAVLLISHKKVDERLSSKYPKLEFVRIEGAPLLMSPRGIVNFILRQTSGLFQGLALLKKHRPVAVIGFGGFTTAAIILAAWLKRVPVALHEANRVPGKAIRKMSRLARRVYVPTGVSIKGVPAKKVLGVGLPVRSEIQRQDPSEARVQLGLLPKLKTLVVFGGSQGATALNEWVEQNEQKLAEINVQVYCVTGPGKGADLRREITNTSGVSCPSVRASFCDQVATLLSAATLVLGRAGAGTMAELARCETPSVLVPYPFAADNHQQANADWFAGRGAACVVDQQRLDTLLPLVESLLSDEKRLGGMKQALREIADENPLQTMIKDLEGLTSDKSNGHGAGREVCASA